MKIFKYLTVLTTTSILWFIFLIIFFFLISDSSNYKFLAFIGLSIIGFIGLLIDFFFKKVYKKQKDCKYYWSYFSYYFSVVVCYCND